MSSFINKAEGAYQINKIAKNDDEFVAVIYPSIYHAAVDAPTTEGERERDGRQRFHSTHPEEFGFK